ncbi:peptidase S8 and S53 subtilisin kexin sedolisin [Actinomadura darangshiensis]|uniref:Peptidase S8 and S53 subtilisin kexin sedolisin n=1 Tax=Actinomadura darangshiensis TaxID=705336 RepID=A0A4V2YXR4_9ACTN|nr:S8/S53 family peptidase [Actinomadura darangshiensis]TDD90477.1 peptidase S8 and S53 subtilisin kexin sedolisin [Actinomadura darangshiensis]
MFDQQARLERLLARHRDAVVVEPLPGRPALIRRDEILVAGQDAGAAEGLVQRWCDSRQDEHGVTVLRLRAPAKVDVCELAAVLGSGGRHRRLSVSPNHLVLGQPMWWSGPADRPRPAAPMPAPGPVRARRDVTVAILDTGLSPHPWYADADWFREQRDEVGEVLDADLDFELDAQAGHGTFIAGVVLSQAPSAALRARRVIGGDGVGDELDVIRALESLARRGRADVVNISLGCHTYDDRPSPVLSRAVAALGRRTVIVACAGNAATDRPFWPAAMKPVVGVAALDGPDRAWFSNYGWWVDACAQGVGLASTFVRFDGSRPVEDGTDPDRFDGFATWSGTSFAAPVVAGRIAALAAEEDIDPCAAADRVLDPGRHRSLPDLGTEVHAESAENALG